MTKNKQIIQNIKLSEKLANYVAENPQKLGNLPAKASFVTFSVKDKKLNEENKKLLEGLKKEGKRIIKAQETADKNNPWRFTLIPS